MNTFYTKFILLGFSMAISFVFGQQYNFTNLSVSDGLAQSQVYDILEDSRGYLWLATQGGGLSRFDGKYFRNYGEKEGLLGNFVASLEEDKNGNLLIGTSKGLSVFNGQNFKNYCLNEACTFSIQKIIKTASGDILIASSNGLYTFSQGQFSDSPLLAAKYVQTIFEDNLGKIWAATGDSLYIINKDLVEVVVVENNCDQDITSIVQDDSLTIWIGTYGGGLCSYKDGVFTGVSWHPNLKSARILSLHFEGGILWVATIDNGIAKCSVENQSCIFLKEKDGLANNNVRCVEQDDLGNVWIGTSGGGVSRYSGEEFVHYNRSIGLEGNYVYAVARGLEKDVFVANSGLGIQRVQGNQIEEYPLNSTLPRIKIKSLYLDRDSMLWCGSEGKGVFVVSNDTLVRHIKPNQNGMKGAWINQIIEDESGFIWIASVDAGIAKVNKKEDGFEFENYNGNQLINNNVVSLAFDMQGVLWYASRYGGVSYLTDGSPQIVYNTSNQLKSNSYRSILIDSLNYLWLGSVSEGIAYANLNNDSIQFKFLTQTEGLSSNNIYQLTLDEEDNLWVGSQKGLDKISLDISRNVLDISHFSIEEGFVGVETNQNASCKDRDGNLWFGTVNGLTKYSPGNAVENLIPPKLVIQDVSLFYESLGNTQFAQMLDSWNQFQEKVTFPYDQNHLSFDFIGINLSNPSKVSYQWMLEGFDKDWTPISNKTSATYSNIPSGEYIFKVKASNEDSVWSAPKEYGFVIAIPFWKEWYFIIGASIFWISMVSLFVYSRINRVKQEAALKSEMISLEQKAMQLQMNPHFVFNTLNSIQGLVAENNNKEARLQLAKFSKLMRAILENSLALKIPLSKEIETLKSYLQLEQAIQTNPFEFELILHDEFDASFIEIPAMLLQPFVENAILHGVKSKGSDGFIQIVFTQKETYLECIIQDNGIGRNAADNLKQKQKPFHVSTALEVTEKRLKNLGKEMNPLQFVDLYDNENKAIGTKVIVLIPLS